MQKGKTLHFFSVEFKGRKSIVGDYNFLESQTSFPVGIWQKRGTSTARLDL